MGIYVFDSTSVCSGEGLGSREVVYSGKRRRPVGGCELGAGEGIGQREDVKSGRGKGEASGRM